MQTTLLSSIASQMMTADRVDVHGSSLRPAHEYTAPQDCNFRHRWREYTAIEQNPEKPSRGGQLAREGHRVVQFKEVETNRFVAVAVDGDVRV